jgi:phenylacetate-CoA ligase
VPRPHPKAIITSAETLYDHHREVIEEEMGCKIFDEYGSNEISVYGTECDHGSMHVHPEFGMMQIEPIHSRAQQHSFGNPICTSLINQTMPLIRYRMSDLVEFGPPCSCGRHMPVLSRIIGREEDLIITPEGNYVARLDPVFKHARGVIEAQVIQEAIDSIRVRFVPSLEEPLEVTIKTLETGLKDKLGDSMKFEYETTDAIERTAGGKFKAVISKVKSQALT